MTSRTGSDMSTGTFWPVATALVVVLFWIGSSGPPKGHGERYNGTRDIPACIRC